VTSRVRSVAAVVELWRSAIEGKLATEKVGERQAKVVRYRVGKGGNDDPKVAVSIDAETGLPLKRVLFAHPEGEKILIAEAYGAFKLNPKIDAKAFELPK